MVLFLIVAGATIGLLFTALRDAFMANAVLNGVIIGVLIIGIVHAFRTVTMLRREVAWTESFRRDGITVSSASAPRLLAPMATMLGEKTGRISLSTMAMRTLLDGIAARLDESREISRYMIGLLVFLGLLGTFWGLLETVQAVGNVVGGLQIGGNDINTAFGDLKNGLQAPISGMGTAFSSSLFGLAGSLVLGFLELQAGQAQNRFYNDLEEWLSGLTRLGSGGVTGDGEQSVPAYIQALLEQTADGLEGLQRALVRSEENRTDYSRYVYELTEKISALTGQMSTEQSLMLKLAESQQALQPILAKLAEKSASSSTEEASRAHLRNIETYLGRIREEMGSGRNEAVQEIRSEIRLLARTIAALAEDTER
ncbi:MAG: flagellar motor protein MotA [Proteobacteria bacterium]|nr:flagellar motor protein MotA [Pseudomonadota bacterium]